MSYSLEDFCADTRAILSARDNPTGRDEVRQKLEQLLQDQDFCAEYVGSDNDAGLRQIYEDPELGFCVLAYNMAAPRTSPPHDHGNSWAVYGQAVGHTDMTIWSATEDSIEPVRNFRLEPGQAGLFDVREIHSIEYNEGAKFVRVTGVDMNQENRRVWDPETGAVKEIESVGAGSAKVKPTA
jgi:predicted metal-dependent enzyme (double-stranded beta helix superfamily)